MWPALLALLGGGAGAAAGGAAAGGAAAGGLGAGAGGAALAGGGASALPSFMSIGGGMNAPAMSLAGEKAMTAGGSGGAGHMENIFQANNGQDLTPPIQMPEGFSMAGIGGGMNPVSAQQGTGIPGANISAQGKQALDDISSNSTADTDPNFTLLERLFGKSGLKGVSQEEWAGMDPDRRASLQDYLESNAGKWDDMQMAMGSSGGGMEAKDMGGSLGMGDIMGRSRSGGQPAARQPAPNMMNKRLMEMLNMGM